MTEPGEDLCLTCHHPDHDDEGCGVLMGSGLYGSDGIEVPSYCRCTGYVAPTGQPTAPDPWTDPDAAARNDPPPF